MGDSTPIAGYDRTSYILMVDDDNTLLKFFKIHLNKFYSKVIVVKNAKEAIDSIREKDIDLVITDVNMPKTDGIQLIKKIHKHDPSIPCLLISGGVFSDEKNDEIIEESDGYLRKPFDVDELHDFINAGMKLREHMSKLASILNNTQKKKFRTIINSSDDLAQFMKKDHPRTKAKEIIDDILKEYENARLAQTAS